MTLAISCDAFVRLFSNDIAPVRALRTLGLGIVDAIGPARRFFASHAGGAVGDLPKLLRGESLGAPA
jgi:2-octaprenyl-6-methoxyphenol hydroxylase